ncbi:MAG: nitronate monooxygenase, partial [Chloroflexi bacterium]|nr:nitronate monooxygenase [Chloroflexota bacterium]
MKKNRVSALLGIEHPIVQAPMVWITGADLAAAVSNAGALGTIGMNAGAAAVTADVVETGERLRSQIRKAKSLTGKPFAVNLAAAAEGPGRAFSDRCLKVVLEEKVQAVVVVGDNPVG